MLDTLAGLVCPQSLTVCASARQKEQRQGVMRVVPNAKDFDWCYKTTENLWCRMQAVLLSHGSVREPLSPLEYADDDVIMETVHA